MTKITSIKITNNYVELKLNNSDSYKISEDDFFDYKFKANMEIDQTLYQKIKHMSNYHMAYMKALNKIKYKDRSEWEIRHLLYEDFDLIKPDVDKIINKLKRYDFINDQRYTEDFIEQSRLKYHGHQKIKSELIDVRINSDILDDLMPYDFKIDYNLAFEYADKIKDTIRQKTKVQVENSIRQKLSYRGFKADVIGSVISDIELDYNYDLEKVLIQKDFEKSLKRYSRKYEGYNLRVKLFTFLSTKGYRYEMINEILDEMEIENE